jgi:hypothetical protein
MSNIMMLNRKRSLKYRAETAAAGRFLAHGHGPAAATKGSLANDSGQLRG